MNGLIDRLEADGMLLLERPGADALFQDSKAEYSLNSRVTGCWITVDSLSVYLKREGERLVVQVFPLHQEQAAIACLEAQNPTPS